MAPRKNDHPTLPVVNREAAEILEQFLNRRLEVVNTRTACHEAIAEEVDEKHCRLKVSDSAKVAASLETVTVVDYADYSVSESSELLNPGDTRPHSLPADFRNKIKSDVDIQVLLSSIKKGSGGGGKPGSKKLSGFAGLGKTCTDCDGSTGNFSDSSDNYPDEDWLRQKPRKKKNFFKRTKERLQHAFKLQQNKKRSAQQLLYTDIGVLEYSDTENRKRGKRKKGKRLSDTKRQEFDGYSSATRSESTTPGRHADLLVDVRSCNLKRVQSDEVFKHKRVDIKNVLPVSSYEEPPISVVWHLREKILNPIRRSFRRSKSKGSESGSITNEVTVQGNQDHDSIFRRPRPDIPRPLLPGDENYHAPKVSENDSKTAAKVFKEILSYDIHDGVSPPVESPPYVNFYAGKISEPIYANIDNAHSQTSFEDIDEPEQEAVWVPRVQPDCVGKAHRDNLFLPGLRNSVENAGICAIQSKSEFSYKTLTYAERQVSTIDANVTDVEGKVGLYGIIAQKLSTIADTCVARIDSESTGHSDSDSSKNQEKTSLSNNTTKDPPPIERLSSLERQIITCLRQSGDKIAQSHDFPTSTATHLIQHAGYGAFKKTMQNTIGSEPGWNQVAMLFYVANSAVRLAGASGALASKVKENTLRYFEDKFAEWIVGQGGWDSMLEDTSTPDTELD